MSAEVPVTFTARDGTELEGRRALPPGARSGVVLCHPHPLYGGDMESPVVQEAGQGCRAAGLATLRFNFRGVGRSGGVHASGRADADDARAALRCLGGRLGPGHRLGLLGYSFGAAVAAAVGAAPPPGLAALCLVAPPLAVHSLPVPRHRLTFLVVAGTRDHYCPADRAADFAAGVPGAEHVLLAGADHFLWDALGPLAEVVQAWCRRWRGP